MNGLEFGVFDTTDIPDTIPMETAAALHAHIADAQMAERLGYQYFFFIEHQNAGFPCVSAPTVYLTALACATKSIRVGAMVFQLPFHQPIKLAQDVAMIDQLSHGRVDFGFGYGTRVREFEPWGADFNERRAMGQEVLDVVIKTWTEREVTYPGRFWKMTGATPQPHPYQQPHPPVWQGVHSLTSIEFAAAHNFNVSQIFEVEKTTDRKFRHFREQCAVHRHGGPKQRTMLVRHVHVAKTDKLAREQAEQYMLNGIQGPAGVERALALRPKEATPDMMELARVYLETSRSVDFWLDEGLGFIGSPQTVAKAIQAQHARVGYDVLLLNHQFVDMPRDLYTSSLELFGAEVIPMFASKEIASACA